MNRCPITYESIPDDRKYSEAGLKKLSPQLKDLLDFPLSAADQIKEAALRGAKMSIQGVQPKLSAVLSVPKQTFEIVDTNGRYILKPQNLIYPELPENEDLTMRLASSVGIDVPLHGLIYCIDGSRTYFIKRFDRHGHGDKYAVEDFAQLSEERRDTKYNASMERVAKVIEKFCTFPAIEKKKLFRLVIFNFLVGNEDMHLKNFSLITRGDKTELSPAYDLLNSTTPNPRAQEELALTLKGKKRKVTRNEFLDYFADSVLSLQKKVVEDLLKQFSEVLPDWRVQIAQSFLSEKMKAAYGALLDERVSRIGL